MGRRGPGQWQRLGLVVEGLIGWGAVAQRNASAPEADVGTSAFSVRLNEDATVDAEFVEVTSILATDTNGQYFYIWQQAPNQAISTPPQCPRAILSSAKMALGNGFTIRHTILRRSKTTALIPG